MSAPGFGGSIHRNPVAINSGPISDAQTPECLSNFGAAPDSQWTMASIFDQTYQNSALLISEESESQRMKAGQIAQFSRARTSMEYVATKHPGTRSLHELSETWISRPEMKVLS